MASNDYHFVTHWRVEASIEEVWRLISDARDMPRWWPSVYLNVRQLEAGDENGLGNVFELHTRGWLPYTLRWQLRVTELQFPTGYSFAAFGDFVGRGVWVFMQDGSRADVRFDWQLRAEKALIRHLSFLLKPIFSANHRWAMRQGEKSLRAELARRREKK